MEMVKVNSSLADSMCWKNDILIIRFTTGAVYMYEDVPYKLYKDLVTADSVGHAVNESLKYKPKFPCTKLSA